MTTEFLDSRTSEFSDDDTGTTILPTVESLLVGDIGLQVNAVLNTPNANNVRVSLWGTLGVVGLCRVMK